MSLMNSSTTLESLVLVGSHNSNTKCLKNNIMQKNYGCCQIMNVYEQLSLGVRYLDIRYSVESDVFLTTNDITFEDYHRQHPICDKVLLNGHGFLRGSLLSTVVELIDLFILEHPTEFIIIKLQEESYKLSSLAKLILIRKFCSTFGSRLITGDDMDEWFDISTVTLSQIWKHKKNIILIFREEIFRGLDDNSLYILSKNDMNNNESILNFSQVDLQEIKKNKNKLYNKGLFDKKDYMLEKWHDTDDPSLLLSRVSQYLKDIKSHKNKFRVAQLILTNQRNVWNHVKKFYSKGLISVEKLSMTLYRDPSLSNFLLDHLQRQLIQIGKAINS